MVSQAQFDQVQAKLATNRSFARRNNTAHHYLLRALVSCGAAAWRARGARSTGGTAYYSAAASSRAPIRAQRRCCPARHAPVGQLDALVWQDLCALLSEPEPLAAAVARAHGGAWLPQELLARRETCAAAGRTCTSNSSGSPMPTSGGHPARRVRAPAARPGAAHAGAGRAGAAAGDDAERQRQLAGVAASLESSASACRGAWPRPASSSAASS